MDKSDNIQSTVVLTVEGNEGCVNSGFEDRN